MINTVIAIARYRRTDGILKDALPLFGTAVFNGATVCGMIERTRLRRALFDREDNK